MDKLEKSYAVVHACEPAMIEPLPHKDCLVLLIHMGYTLALMWVTSSNQGVKTRNLHSRLAGNYIDDPFKFDLWHAGFKVVYPVLTDRQFTTFSKQNMGYIYTIASFAPIHR